MVLENGRYRVKVEPDYVEPDNGPDIGEVCPFYNASRNESVIGDELFPGGKPDEGVGRHLAVYAGHVTRDNYRQEGSSGGMTTYVLAELLTRGEIDAVLHVRRSHNPLFKYAPSLTLEELRAAPKSRYYPVEFSDVMEFARERAGRYALVGVPCFIKAARLLAEVDSVIASRIVYHVSLVCGHLKTTGYAEMLGWQLGVPPRELSTIDFRSKDPRRPANRYRVEVEGSNAVENLARSAPASELFGTDWGTGFFKLKACDYCDDIAGETADITLGDAWIPPYQYDPAGTNVAVVRNSRLAELLNQGREDQSLKLDEVTPEDFKRSQAANFRHRREGLAYRLWLTDLASTWRPTKRVLARHDHIDRTRQRIYEQRVLLAATSIDRFEEAKKLGSLEYFERSMKPLVDGYYRLYKPLWRRVAGKAKRLLARIFRA